MTHEQLEEANNINKEIKRLKEYIIPILEYQKNGRDIDIIFSAESYSDKRYGWNCSGTPEFVKDLLKEDTEFIFEKVLNKINKEITKLEKELQSI